MYETALFCYHKGECYLFEKSKQKYKNALNKSSETPATQATAKPSAQKLNNLAFSISCDEPPPNVYLFVQLFLIFLHTPLATMS